MNEMRPHMKFWEWLDAVELSKRDIEEWPDTFAGYGYIIKTVAMVYIYLCVSAGAEDADFES